MLIKAAEAEELAECATTEAPEPEMRFCPWCGQYLPVTEFRLYHKGKPKRHTECKSCRTTIDAGKAEARRTGKLKQFISKLNRSRSERERHAVFAAAIATLGGPVEFGTLWGELIQKTQARKPALAMRYYSQLVATMIACAEEPSAPDDYNDVDDEDIERELLRMVRAAEDRELAEPAWGDE